MQSLFVFQAEMSAGPSLALLGRAVSEPEEHMRFYIAGGVGDQGRNCFYVQGGGMLS